MSIVERIPVIPPEEPVERKEQKELPYTRAVWLVDDDDVVGYTMSEYCQELFQGDHTVEYQRFKSGEALLAAYKQCFTDNGALPAVVVVDGQLTPGGGTLNGPEVVQALRSAPKPPKAIIAHSSSQGYLEKMYGEADYQVRKGERGSWPELMEIISDELNTLE